MVDIATEWNLKGFTSRSCKGLISRYSNRMEFKDMFPSYSMFAISVDIATEWNLKFHALSCWQNRTL